LSSPYNKSLYIANAGVEVIILKIVGLTPAQGCQIFMVQYTYQSGEKYTKAEKNIPNDYKITK
jgi:hypothetical protein